MAERVITWDEHNLEENKEDALRANRMKIEEPKTPFHRLEADGVEPQAFPPKAEAAKPGGRLHGDTVTPTPEMFAAISAAAEERQANAESPPEDVEGAQCTFAPQLTHDKLRPQST